MNTLKTKNKMKTFIMCIGLPGCGKSTWCTQQETLYGTVSISTDKIREELYGSESEQGDPNKVFKIAKDRVVNGFEIFDTVILDATNIQKKHRIHFIKAIKQSVNNVVAKAVWFVTPVDICKERNFQRDRVVSEYVIDKMYKLFSPPGKEEGFDEFAFVINYDIKTNNAKTIEKFLQVADSFDQQNKHHTLTLGEHVRKASQYVKEHGGSDILCTAALLHDVGKPVTASHKNSKGETTEELHYYQHHCCGAYEIPFYLFNDENFSIEDIVYIANLVYYHMHPLREWKSDKKRKKDEALFPKEFLKDLLLLNEGDVASH